MSFNIATYNVRGVATPTKQLTLIEDMRRYGIDCVCLQETKVSTVIDTNTDTHRILLEPGRQQRLYGMGMIISKKWAQDLTHHQYITDRIFVAHFKHAHTTTKVINIYAPTQQKCTKDPAIRDEFYERKRTNILP